MSTTIDFEKMHAVVEELQKYAEMEDTELGETCQALVQLSHYPDYVSDEFQAALYKEMVEQLENFQENATIVESTETWTRPVFYLKWE